MRLRPATQQTISVNASRTGTRTIPRLGASLVDTLLAVSILSVLMSSMAQVQSEVEDRRRAINIANTLNQITPLARTYLQQNYQALNALIPSGKVLEIPLYNNPNWNAIGDLASSSGALPQNWIPVLPGGQIIRLVVRHVPYQGTTPEHLAGLLITTGNPPMSDRQVGMAGMFSSGLTGIITRANYGTIKANTLHGLSGTWTEKTADWSSAVSITYGHVAVFLTGSIAPTAPYLNRYNIGNSEANRLHTSIDVNSNDLNNVRNMTGVNTMRLTGEAGAIDVSNGINTCGDNTWGCGISVSDDGGIYDLNDYWLTVRMANPNFGLHVEGNVKVDRNIGTNGLDPTSGIPESWGGGVHTWDVYGEATIAAGHNGTINAYMGGAPGSDKEGAVVASTYSQAQVLRPTLTVVEDQICGSTSANKSILANTSSDSGDFTASNGDIAKDAHGATMTCVDGKWHSTTNTFSKFVRNHQCGIWGGENNTSKTHLMELEFQAGKKGAMGVVSVNGVEAAYVDYSQAKGFLGVGKGGSVTHTVTFSLPPYSRWTTRTGHVNNICVTEME